MSKPVGLSAYPHSVSLMVRGACLLVWLMLAGLAHAQATPTPDPLAEQAAPVGRFSVSNGAPSTGVTFALSLEVDVPRGVTLLDWPSLPDTWGDFEVVARDERTETLRDDGGRVISQRFTMRVWRVGDHTTPETVLTYRVNGAGELRVPVRPAFLTVPTVLDFNDLEVRPPLPPINLPYLSPLLVAGVLLVLFVFSWWLMGFITARHEDTPKPLMLSAYEVAVRQLEALRDSTLTADAVLSGAADTMRGYLTARLQMDIAAATTTEITQAASEHLPLELVTGVTRLFAEADRVKFASKTIDEGAAAQALAYAFRWLHDAESVLSDSPEKAKNDSLLMGEGA